MENKKNEPGKIVGHMLEKGALTKLLLCLGHGSDFLVLNYPKINYTHEEVGFSAGFFAEHLFL